MEATAPTSYARDCAEGTTSKQDPKFLHLALALHQFLAE